MKKQPHPFDVALGQYIRNTRESIGWSQNKLAKAVGISFQQIQKYENAQNRISASTLYEVEKALGSKQGAFMTGVEV